MRCGQERLDLLVRWCQLIGLVPFRMERDAESGRFLSYSFSWRHPLTYWWLTCKILYVTAYVSYNLNRWTTLEKKVAIYQSTKTEILVLFVGTVFSATTCLFIPETLVFRCSYFSKASRHLHEFDTLLEDHHVPACSTRKFTVIGIVSALILLGPSWYAHEKFSKGSSILYALDASLYAYNQLRLRTAYVFLYVSYYSIGHRINCLRHILKDTIDLKDSNTPSNPITCDRHPKKALTGVASVNEAFDVLCRAGVRLSSAFSMFGFWMVIFITTMTIWDGFMLSSSLRKWKMENNSSFLGYGIDRIMLWVFMDLLALVITCFSADLPARQIKRLRQRLISLSLGQFSDRKKIQISTFLMQLTEDRIQISAAGIFNVGMHLIPSLAGAAVTYLVILIQTTN